MSDVWTGDQRRDREEFLLESILRFLEVVPMSWYGLRGAAKGFPVCGMAGQSHRLRGLCVLGARALGVLNVEILTVGV